MKISLQEIIHEIGQFTTALVILAGSFLLSVFLVFWGMPIIAPPVGDDLGYPLIVLVIAALVGSLVSFGVLRMVSPRR
jgi:hypothetical protein